MSKKKIRSAVATLPFNSIKQAVQDSFPDASSWATTDRSLFFLKSKGKIILPGKIPAGSSVRKAWENVYVYLHSIDRIGSMMETDLAVTEMMHE